MKTCVTARWNGRPSDVRGFCVWARDLRQKLDGNPSLAMVFWTPEYFANASDLCEELQLTLRIGHVIGCSSTSLISNHQEFEGQSGITVSIHHFPGTEIRSYHVEPELIREGKLSSYWESHSPFTPGTTNSFIALIDPMTADIERWIGLWDEAFGGKPIFGGLAVGSPQEMRSQLYLDGRLRENGAVLIGLEGQVEMRGMTSQGCLPIGEPRPITRSHKNIIEQIGNVSAFKVLSDTLRKLPPEQQVKLQGNLFMGLAFNEYQESFKEGDFLIRNLVEADPVSGNLAVAATLRSGQTIQFQQRDSSTASRELHSLLKNLYHSIRSMATHGSLLCSCLGRGSGLFKSENHDASTVRQYFPDLPINGFFANGEIGLVGNRNFIHGYTATLGIFCSTSHSS
ncbi:MAG: FIST C-terminal domain-containing protein [Verrucomicrobia bacterium]|nr:FIST C-terminal domain-containing protein [Verrucomicrobiota bacterium]